MVFREVDVVFISMNDVVFIIVYDVVFIMDLKCGIHSDCRMWYSFSMKDEVFILVNCVVFIIKYDVVFIIDMEFICYNIVIGDMKE